MQALVSEGRGGRASTHLLGVVLGVRMQSQGAWGGVHKTGVYTGQGGSQVQPPTQKMGSQRPDPAFQGIPKSGLVYELTIV